MAAAGTVAVALAAAGACCLYAEVLALRAERAESRARQAPTDGGDKQQTRRGRRRHRPPADDGRVSPSQPARKCRNDGKRRVCVGCSGSVAAVKAVPIVRELVETHGIYVDLVLTRSGAFFQSVDYRGERGWDELHRLSEAVGEDGVPWLQVWRDHDEWDDYGSLSDTVLHVDLAKRNRVLLVAPLCANTLGNLALGLCPNLLTSLVRAWYYDMDPSFAAPLRTKYGDHVMSKPVLVAPAMNTYMLEQQVTHGHLRTLRDRGVSILDSVVKTLACGDTGKGAMADVAVIVAATVAALDRYEASLAQAASENRPDFVP